MTSTVDPLATSPPLHAPIKWAQRSDRILLTVDLHDAQNVQVLFTDTSMKFSGECDGIRYESELTFHENIDDKASLYKVLPRSVQIVAMKKDTKKENGNSGHTFWPHLLKNRGLEKNKYELTVDWNRWID